MTDTQILHETLTHKDLAPTVPHLFRAVICPCRPLDDRTMDRGAIVALNLFRGHDKRGTLHKSDECRMSRFNCRVSSPFDCPAITSAFFQDTSSSSV